MIPSPSSEPQHLYHIRNLTYTRVGLALLFAWLFWGDFVFTLMERVVPSIIPLKLKELDASNTAMGLILTTLPMLISTTINPIVSFKSDRYRGRWGRRIPFIIATLPMLVVCLIALGFGDQLGFWLHRNLSAWTSNLSANQFTVIIIGVLMVLFSFFNAFVNAVFWYLFNDVVPEILLARFMAGFRVSGLLAGAFYNFFIFRYAESYTGTIFAGAAVFYFIGFGLMCLKVKEGEYPPPPPYVDGKTGAWSAIKTYAQECHHKLYVLIFALGIAQAAVWASAPFTVFFYEATGLNLHKIGFVNGCNDLATAAMALGAGWLADRYHPVRVMIAGLLIQVLLAGPAQLIWLVWSPSHRMSFYLWIAITIGLSAPAGALWGVLGVVYMRLFPKDRFGQFCSANNLWRSLALILLGMLVGMFFDETKKIFGEAHAYFWVPVWQTFFYGLMLFFAWRIYLIWQKHGGDADYKPPGF